MGTPMKQTGFGEIVNYENGNTRFHHNIPFWPKTSPVRSPMIWSNDF